PLRRVAARRVAAAATSIWQASPRWRRPFPRPGSGPPTAGRTAGRSEHMHTSSSSALPGARPHPSVHGGIVVLRPALDAVPDATADDADEVVGTVPPSEIRAALLELFEIGPPVVSPHDEANPTWVEEHSDSTVELLELSEALSRVDASERAALVAEH